MSAALSLVEQTNSTPPQAPTSGQSYDGGMNQVIGGPAGLLYTLANEMIALYNKFQALYNEMTKAERDVQEKTINAGADAQRSYGMDQYYGLMAQGVGSLASAVVTGVTTAGQVRENKANSDALSGHQSELANLNTLDKLPYNPSGVQATNDASALQPQTDPAVEAKAIEMKNGNYHSNDGVDNQRAINAMTPEEHAQFKRTLNEKIRGKREDVNTATTTMTYVQTKWNQQIGQTITNGVNLASQGVQAYTAKWSGQDQAAQQVASGMTSMIDGTANATLGTGNQMDDKKNQALQAAKQAAQTSYAQT